MYGGGDAGEAIDPRRHVPFALNNIMCRDCYGLDRYRRNVPSAWTAPEKPVEVPLTDEEAVAHI